MDKISYAEIFDLNPEERNLHILVCALKDKEVDIPRLEYVDPSVLPHLPFSDHSFDLVLCPNVLFNNKTGQSDAYIRAVLEELARVGGEVRVLPLVDAAGKPSEHLGAVIMSLQERGMGVELRQVRTKELNRIPNAMLRVWNAACLVKN